MVSTYRTEEEQVEAIKSWWKENGKQVVTIVLLFSALVFGWRWWQDHTINTRSEAGTQYQQLLEVIEQGSRGPANETQLQTAKHLTDVLKKDYGSSIYAKYAALLMAKLAVDKGDYAKAEEQLQWVLDNGAELALESLARLRLARIKFASGDADSALAMLEGHKGGFYAAAYEEAKGDIYLDKDEKEKARKAYQAALTLYKQQGSRPGPLLEMKLQGVAVADESLVFDLPDFVTNANNEASKADAK
jgi:predicted negative regulator of RcsB-dependent stress response